MKDSAYNAVYEKLNFEQDYPRIIKLIEAVRGREEMKPALTQKIPQQHLFKEVSEHQSEQKYQLKLPVKYD